MTAKARALIRELVDAELAGREDARVLRPVLTVMIRTALLDFHRYHESRHASLRVRDFDMLMARSKAAKS